MILIHKSKTADSRTCDSFNITIDTLKNSTLQPIEDVKKGCKFFSDMLLKSGKDHDRHKLYTIEDFHKTFINNFQDETWFMDHQKNTRHHLNSIEG
jgi:hypothetical protein